MKSFLSLFIRAAVATAIILAAHLDAGALQASGPAAVRVEGVVTDQTSAPIVGAEVTLLDGATNPTRKTDDEGRFSFEDVTAQRGKLTVKARGFSEAEREWTATNGDALQLTVVLAPLPFSEQVTVTAARTETRLGETAASVQVLSAEDITTTAALTLDDALRQVPGFSLFRRSGSRTANPTTQGVSLRGVGASGASRAVVLVDGIPINDPFGGWVYWGRAPRQAIGQIEVVRGGASHLYGTDALGGVISIIPRAPRDSVVAVEASYGNQDTRDFSMFYSGRTRGWGMQLAGELFNTDGYILVDEDARGLADTRAGASFGSAEMTIDRMISESDRVFGRFSIFSESRENGTPLQTNNTYIRQFATGADLSSERAGSLSLRAYLGAQVFNQDFSAVAPDRNSESLTRSQRVPAQQTGLTSQWSRPFGSNHTVVAGFDAREVRGASDELVFIAGRLSSAVGAGGRERTFGVFGQDIIRITPRWIATVSARADRWRNYRAHSTTQPLAAPGPANVVRFDDRTETAFSPRASLLYRLSDNVSLSVAGYRAFRAPTLNELYRAFRVGNVLTLANADLKAERLTGGEAAASVAALRRLTVRGTFFWTEITRPVANVTVNFTPELITRRRQNLGRTRSRGLELEGEARITDTVYVSSGYQFVDATVLRFPANTMLEGLLIPQVPRHQLTFQARYVNPSRITVAFQGRAVGEQFDDDQNRFGLDRYFTLDAFVSRPITRWADLFAAFENLFDQEYDIGRTPLRTLGPPLLARFGVRLHLGAR
jgi:outer membrane receptor protein involved in Fe transport